MKAKQFSLLDANKNTHRLQDYQGKWLVLYFYPKDNTPGCTIEALEFTALQEEFKKINAHILGISNDSCESHQKFINKKRLSITLLSDKEHKVAEKYGVWKPKKFLGKEFLGIKRSTFLINTKGEHHGIH